MCMSWQGSTEITLPQTVIILCRAIGANLSQMAHENMTYVPTWPVKILDGAKFYPDCAQINNLSVFNISMLPENFQGKYLYPHHFT